MTLPSILRPASPVKSRIGFDPISCETNASRPDTPLMSSKERTFPPLLAVAAESVMLLKSRIRKSDPKASSVE